MFLIKLSKDQYDNIDLVHLYEKQLIQLVAQMNKIYIDNYELSSLCLGCLGVKYKDSKSKTGYLEIEHISDMLKKGYGKCDSIAAWYIMIFEMNNIAAEPHIIPTNKGGFHVQVRFQNGNKWELLDPLYLNDLIFENCYNCKLQMMNGTFRK